MQITDSVEVVKGVGPELAKKLASVGVRTVEDLITYYPRKYDDYSQLSPTNALQPGMATIAAIIKQVKGRYIRAGLHITEAVASDKHGSVRLVWFNQPYRATAIKADTEYFISGNFELSYRKWALMNPSMELVSSFPVNTARLVPVYRQTKDLGSGPLRKCLKNVLQSVKLPEILPPELIKEHSLISRRQAYQHIHFPQKQADVQAAQYRLGFEEVYCLIMASLLNKQVIGTENALAVPFDQQVAQRFVAELPFTLTADQKRAVWEIYQDMQATRPVNRLVEGDVGSGKTVVAAMAAVMALQAGYQVALMAPTELLARQHADTLHTLLQPLGLANRLSLLVGSMSAIQKKRVHSQVAEGQIQFLVGTHALIQDKVSLQELALVIIDEQHRFGVEQRKKLIAKAGHMPHVVSMTATPIPRSLALTLYGELDISIIAHKPTNRQPITTNLVKPGQRHKVYENLKEAIVAGRQAFVVCPAIAESGLLKLRAVGTVHQEITKLFPKARVGLLHGKLPAEQKQQTMQDFAEGTIDILVSTTVIEVGVDVPNASIMLIESPERFGLAQMHQLRGRVGRGEHAGHCYLLLSSDETPSKRLQAIARSQNGFELAQLDLDLRGPGAIYGTFQHGQLDLRMANLSDVQLLKAARTAADKSIKSGLDLLQYPELFERIKRLQAVVHLN